MDATRLRICSNFRLEQLKNITCGNKKMRICSTKWNEKESHESENRHSIKFDAFVCQKLKKVSEINKNLLLNGIIAIEIFCFEAFLPAFVTFSFSHSQLVTDFLCHSFILSFVFFFCFFLSLSLFNSDHKWQRIHQQQEKQFSV